MQRGMVVKEIKIGLVDTRPMVLPVAGFATRMTEDIDNGNLANHSIALVYLPNLIILYRQGGCKDVNILEGIVNLLQNWPPFGEGPYFKLTDDALWLEPTERYLKRFK